jgi:antirestriction protein
MTIKQKFSSIDQSKLTADQKSFLDKIKNVTKNFTDAEMNKKVEAPLDNFIAKAKDKMPEAIKSAPVKRTAKAKTSQTRKPKRTAMSLAKEIRKEGESWKDAQVRARKMMKEDSQSLSKTVESELDKLTKLVRSQKDKEKLAGISGTDIKRDAVRKAKPRGARKVTRSGETSNQYGTYKNHLGRKYYESRDRHSDRLAPRYPKNAPLLESGAYLTDGTFGNFQNQVFAEGGDIDAFTLRMVKSNGMQPAEVLKEDANVKYNRGGAMTNERLHVNKGEDYEVRYSKPRPSRKGYLGKRDFELGGVMATDLAGHTGGGDAGLNAGMPLDGFSNTAYTGLVGETGAMSSGEMFMAGGTIDKNFNLDGYTKYFVFDDFAEAKDYVDLDRKKYPRTKKTVIIKRGNKYEVWLYPVTGHITGNRVYEAGGTLPSGVSQSYMITEALGNPAQHFAKGGGVKIINGKEYSYGRNWTNDHRHINQDEEHEVTYNRKGKFLGIFKEGGAIKNQYAGRTPEDIWDSLSVEQRKHFLIDHLWANEEQIEQIRYKRLEEDDKEFVDYYAVRTWKKLSGDVRKAFTSHVKEGEYNKGGALTNERLHVNHDEDYEVRYAKPRPKRKGYKGARKFMSGGSMETPRIYVADLEAYNNGRLVGEWLDLADYNNADELMDAIQDVLKKSGGEEYAIHDVEYVPRSLYSEYMSKNDFEALYEVMETAKRYDLPLEVVEEIVSQYGEGGVEEFYGKYDDAEDFAMQLVDDIGIESFNSYEYYMYVTDTDRRLIAQEQADFYVDDIRNEDGGNRLIEEAGMDVDEYEEADSEMQEEMLDKAREIVYDEYYDTWYEGLDDPKNFLVDEQGIYDTESFANLSFVRVDYEKLGRDLDQDYTFIEHDGELYVFNIR